MASARDLPFGYKLLEGDYQALWGARLIINQRGKVDFVFDRQGTAGDEVQAKELVRKLNTHYPPKTMMKDIKKRLKNREIKTREAEEVELFDKAGIKVVGNSNASAGYFYVTAMLLS